MQLSPAMMRATRLLFETDYRFSVIGSSAKSEILSPNRDMPRDSRWDHARASSQGERCRCLKPRPWPRQAEAFPSGFPGFECLALFRSVI